MMAGLNHESTAAVGGDLAIDLEVTSNRPDCLGHLGMAREIAVLCSTCRCGCRRRGRPKAPTPVDDWSACGSIAPILSALHGPGDPRREGRSQPGMDDPSGWRPLASRRSTTWSISPTTC